MRQLEYANSAFRLYLDFPPNWYEDGVYITGILFYIHGMDGTEKQGESAATIGDFKTLSSAASAGDSTITLASGGDSPLPGHRLCIVADTSGNPNEFCEILGYNSSTRVVTLKRELKYAHAAATGVKCWYAYKDVSLSSATKYPLGEQLVITWEPESSDLLPIKEFAEIVNFEFSPQDFEQEFESRYPREYQIVHHRLNGMSRLYKSAKKKLQYFLERDGINIDRVVDSSKTIEPILALSRLIVVQGGGAKLADEREVAEKEFLAILQEYKAMVLWQDENQDREESDDEIEDHMQLCGSERGM